MSYSFIGKIDLRFTRCILLFLLACTACGTIATPEFSPSPRSVELSIQPDLLATETPVFNRPFSVETSVDRTHESLCVITNQRTYWEPGDKTETAQVHSIEVQIGDQTFSGNKLFIFWNSASIEDQFDSQGHSIGALLQAPMHICFGTRTLDLGSHHATIQIISTSGKVHAYSWNFEINPLERKEIQPELMPTAEYLEKNPQPVPTFIFLLSTGNHYVDKFVCGVSSQEALTLRVDKKVFGTVEQFHNHLHIMIDGFTLLENDSSVSDTDWGALYVCVNTNNLNLGLHMATIQLIALTGVEYTYSWAFTVQQDIFATPPYVSPLPSLALSPTP